MGDVSAAGATQNAADDIPGNVSAEMSQDELFRLYQAERVARSAADRRLESTLREGQGAAQSAVLRDYVMASAHCLLWYADIHETNVRYLHWDMEFPHLEAAHRFLPIEIQPNETLKDAWYKRRHTDDRDKCDQIGTAAVRAGQSYQQEFRCYCEDGAIRWLHEDVHLETIVPGKHWRAVAVCTDITSFHELKARMQATNKRLQRSVAETHHRVKNSLQVVASLVDMQYSADGQPAEAQTAFQRTAQHIRALAAIHDLLKFEAHAGTDVESVSLRAVMEKLVALIRETVDSRRIRTHVESIRLPARQVTALVVLINELLSNAVKHSRGEIGVTVDLRGGLVHLEVTDEGPGFPSGFEPLVAARVGLEIVESIARWDLQGTLAYETRAQGGGRVRLEFRPGAPIPA